MADDQTPTINPFLAENIRLQARVVILEDELRSSKDEITRLKATVKRSPRKLDPDSPNPFTRPYRGQ